jgi:hypothetical protein
MRGVQITVDCADPSRLAVFWAQVLGYVVEPPPSGFGTWREYWQSRGLPDDELPPEGEDDSDSVVDPDGVGPRVWFQQVPEPKSVKNRVHLDIEVSGGRDVAFAQRRDRVDAEATRLVELGGRQLRVLDGGEALNHYGIVMADPEGNEFCLH